MGVLSVSGRWVATVPAMTIVHVFNRQRLHDILRWQCAIVSISLSTLPIRHSVRLTVVTSDSRVYDITLVKKAVGHEPNVVFVDGASSSECWPLITGCLSLPNGDRVVHGPQAETLLIRTSSGTRLPFSSGNATIAMWVDDPKLARALTGAPDPILLEGDSDGVVSWCSADRGGVVLDMGEPVIALLKFGNSRFLAVSSMGKLVHVCADTAQRQQWQRIPFRIQSCAIVAKKQKLYLISNYRLYVVDIVETLTSSSSCSVQCIPITPRQSSLCDTVAVVAIASGPTDLVALTRDTLLPKFIPNVAEDTPVDAHIATPISITMRGIGAVSEAQAAFKAEESQLDLLVQATQMAVNLQNASHDVLACTLSYRRILTDLLIDVAVSNRSLLTVVAGHFALHLHLSEVTPSGRTIRAFTSPLALLVAGCTATYGFVVPSVSDHPVDVRVFLSFRTESSEAAASPPIIQLHRERMTILTRAIVRDSGLALDAPAGSVRRHHHSWIHSRCTSASDSPTSLPKMSFCRIPFFRPDSTMDLASAILHHLIATCSNGASFKCSSHSDCSVDLVLDGDSMARITASSMAESPIGTISIDCGDERLLPIWRACIVERLSTFPRCEFGADAVTRWRSIVNEQVGPSMGLVRQKALVLQRTLEDMHSPSSSKADMTLSGYQWSENAATLLTNALALYKQIRDDVSTPYPM